MNLPFRTGFARMLLLHLAAWCSIVSVVLLLFFSSRGNQDMADVGWHIKLHILATLVLIALLFYLYSYLLVPYLFYRKKYLLFFAVTLMLLWGFSAGINYYFSQLMEPSPGWPDSGLISPDKVRFDPEMDSSFSTEKFPDGFPPPPIDEFFRKEPKLPYTVSLLPFFTMLVSSMAFRYFLDGEKRENDLKEGKMAALSSELLFLKSQISPHFLFNVLNNLTYLARMKSEMLEPSLLRLSSLLRYMLYDTNDEKVPLDKEIKCLDDYISLQQIRHHDISLLFSYSNETEDLQIAPMLLIPFVENAFKHAGSFIDTSSFIRIELSAKNNTLFFKVVNKYSETGAEQKDKNSGIGLVNVQKRLSLLYPGHHELLIGKEDGIFTISLRIILV